MSPLDDSAISDPLARHEVRVRAARGPLVSFIVTCHNYAEYVTECLESIRSQEYSNFECVVVDDASSDRSGAVIESYVREACVTQSFKVVRHAENRGQLAAFGTGLANTSGAFVVFVDADDLLFTDFTRTHLATHLDGGPAVAFTCSDFVQIDSEGGLLSSTCPTHLRSEQRRSVEQCRYTSASLSWRLTESGVMFSQFVRAPVYLPPVSQYTGTWLWSATSAMMFRRATLQLILCPEAERLRPSGDYYVCMFGHAIGGSALIPTVHGCYRRHHRNAFATGTIVGSDQSLEILDSHADMSALHQVFVEHLITEFDTFKKFVDSQRIYLLITKFSPARQFRSLLREARDRGLSRSSLIKYRYTWRLVALLAWLRVRLYWLRRLTRPVNLRDGD